jgi:hypothetical protein
MKITQNLAQKVLHLLGRSKLECLQCKDLAQESNIYGQDQEPTIRVEFHMSCQSANIIVVNVTDNEKHSSLLPW